MKPVEPENITGNLTKEEAPSIVEVKKFLFFIFFLCQSFRFLEGNLEEAFLTFYFLQL